MDGISAVGNEVEGRSIHTEGTLETITGWIISTTGDSEDEERPETKQ